MKVFWIIMSLLMLVGCASQKAELLLTSSKATYLVGEPLEFQIEVTAKEDGVSFVGATHFTDWMSLVAIDPSLRGESLGLGPARTEEEEDAFNFQKPLRKWSVLPCIVIEYEVIRPDYCSYGLNPIQVEMEPVIRLSRGEAWKGKYILSDEMMKRFPEEMGGRYAFRATLNQPRAWPNRVVGVSSKTVIIEIKRDSTKPTDPPPDSR